ncbi:aminoglycoside phosphotransferase family protein [Gallaecimonas sp. GXIMD4217]|uniref:phosphotransferase family protein n=1 Tax=Gallaecimonas sp. GXIMD4217 TaxID=3131927 RepID=UPI00311AEEA0
MPHMPTKRVCRLLEKYLTATASKPQVSNITPLLAGVTNDNFLVTLSNKERWVLKLAKGYIKNGLAKEAHAYSLVRNTSLGIDNLFDKGQGERDGLLIKYIAGRTDTAWSETLLTELAQVLSTVHQVNSQYGGNLLKPKATILNPANTLEQAWRYFCRRQEAEDPRLLDIKARVTNILNAHQAAFTDISHFSLVHGDLHPGNIITHPVQGLKLIDWERAHFGDPAFDLVLINWHGNGPVIDRSIQQQVVKLYAGDGASKTTLPLRVCCWSLYRLFTDHLFLLRFGLVTSKSEQFFEETEQLLDMI